MSHHKLRMGIVSLNWYFILEKVITKCGRKIEQVGSYSSDCQDEW